MPQILLLNGPNLNLLGIRQPVLYGSTQLKDIEEAAKAQGTAQGVEVETFQSNHKGALVDRIHALRGVADVVVINPGAFTPTSVAIRDALFGVGVPSIEVHITNVHARETFRNHNYLSDVASAVICDLGTFGYTAAIDPSIKNLITK